MTDLDALRSEHAALVARGLDLSMTRGQPSDEQFDLSNGMLDVLGSDDELVTPSGVALRNYPGGPAGLPEARKLMGNLLGVDADNVICGNNASLMLMSQTLLCCLIRGARADGAPWSGGDTPPKMIVTIPGYDRHFTLLQGLGFELVTVGIDDDGPDLDAIESLVADDPSIKGVFFVPVYSNPTGDSISDANVDRLASMTAAAPDFTVFADNAYGVHHLGEDRDEPKNLLDAAAEAGNPDRVVLFGSTSKITFSGAGIGAMATSDANVAHFSSWLSLSTIGPNKLEQWRHVKFLDGHPGGLAGLMEAHAEIIGPKFEAVQRVLRTQLGDSGLAEWTDPKGGYFVHLVTAEPIARRVVELAGEAGVALTPAGATHVGGVDPDDRNIRLAPTRPPLAEVEQAMEVVALCIRLASAELAAD
ncbi:MAG: aminotransferase class I/II-fold pyridoxal phosphate-dependent enzyme [Actinomycetota bacterium]